MRFLKVAVLLLALPPSSLYAAAQRTFVSTTGLDTDPCSRTQPCRTFTAATAQTVSGGEVYVLDSGGYGATVISTSISIRADGVTAGVTATSGYAIDVNAGASDVVTLSGLTINGVGGAVGIGFENGAALHLERLRVANFSQIGILVRTAANVTLTDSIIRETGGGPGLTVFDANASVDRTRFEHNVDGIIVRENGRVVARDCVASGNSTGFWALTNGSSPAELTLEHCVAAGNTIAIESQQYSAGPYVPTVRISNVTVSDNGTGLDPILGAILSFGNNQVYGNGIDGAPTGLVNQQ